MHWAVLIDAKRNQINANCIQCGVIDDDWYSSAKKENLYGKPYKETSKNQKCEKQSIFFAF